LFSRGLDFIVFYMFFEGVLIPDFLISGILGQAAAAWVDSAFQVLPLHPPRLGADLLAILGDSISTPARWDHGRRR